MLALTLSLLLMPWTIFFSNANVFTVQASDRLFSTVVSSESVQSLMISRSPPPLSHFEICLFNNETTAHAFIDRSKDMQPCHQFSHVPVTLLLVWSRTSHRQPPTCTLTHRLRPPSCMHVLPRLTYLPLEPLPTMHAPDLPTSTATTPLLWLPRPHRPWTKDR